MLRSKTGCADSGTDTDSYKPTRPKVLEKLSEATDAFTMHWLEHRDALVGAAAEEGSCSKSNVATNMP